MVIVERGMFSLPQEYASRQAAGLRNAFDPCFISSMLTVDLRVSRKRKMGGALGTTI